MAKLMFVSRHVAHSIGKKADTAQCRIKLFIQLVKSLPSLALAALLGCQLDTHTELFTTLHFCLRPSAKDLGITRVIVVVLVVLVAFGSIPQKINEY